MAMPYNDKPYSTMVGSSFPTDWITYPLFIQFRNKQCLAKLDKTLLKLFQITKKLFTQG